MLVKCWSNAGQMPANVKIVKVEHSVEFRVNPAIICPKLADNTACTHQAGLLLAVAAREAEAEERDEVRVAIDPQDRHLPQELREALERRLAQPNARAGPGRTPRAVN